MQRLRQPQLTPDADPAMLEPVQSAALSRAPSVAHGFFTRAGGVSTGVYASLNCGLGSDDERAAVIENRARVARHLGTDAARLLTCHQCHSATAILVDMPWPPHAQPKADALVTIVPGLALGALAADCTPVLFADPVARVVGAAHAGWKGALAGILEATLAVMEQAGAKRADIIAAVGPCISQGSYEVGPEFEATFCASDPSNGRFFQQPRAGARTHFDLPGFVVHRLAAAGTGTIDDMSACTYTHPNQFFSFRRTTHGRESDYGRQISAVMLA